ncbi:MAG TPA: TetR/AcrR family transcriptional regulator [Candidatus Dormibacteraeota bacterium]
MKASPQGAGGRGRRAELIRAAYERIATGGFEGLRTRDVAADVGVNVATLHYHFPTKEALVRAVVGYALSRFVSTLAGEGTPWEQLRAHLQGIRRLIREEPQLPAVMSELAMRANRDPALAELMNGADQAWHAWLTGLLAGDPAAAGKATVVMSTLRGLFVVPSTGQPERVDQALTALEAMLGT